MKTTLNKITATAILLIAFGFTSSSAQSIAVGMKSTVTGSQLANAPAFTASFEKNVLRFEGGLRYQPHQHAISGVESTIGFKVADGTREHAHLFIIATTSYNFSSALSRGACYRESMMARESIQQFRDVRLNTIEYALGFELKADHGKFIHSFYGIGFGGYNTLGTCSCPLYRQKQAVMLSLSLGLSFSILK